VEEAVLDPVVIESLRQLTPPGEPDVLAEVLTIFLHETPKRLGRVQEAWRLGDHAEVHRTAHSLKGSTGNIGARSMFVICRDLDEKMRSTDLSHVPELLAALTREYARVEAEIARVLV
jgi:HPt (histidine-containing phosphotransfer) domain-containing protein